MNFKKTPILNIRVLDVTCPKSKKTFVKGRSFHSLSYRHSGMISSKTGENTLYSKEDYVTFVPKGLSYETEVFEQSDISLVQFELAQDIPIDDIYSFDAKNSCLKTLFSLLSRKYNEKIGLDFKCMSIFYEILDEIEKHWIENQIQGVSAKIIKAQTYILKNYSNSFLSISDVAKYIGVSESYLRREFHLFFKCTPNEYLNKVRLSHAKAMLSIDYNSVTETAKKCGFNSISYFIQSFKKHIGKTPSEYRAKL